MFLIRHFGVTPAYLLLVFVGLAYTLFDAKTRIAISAFRRRLGLSAGFKDQYRHIIAFGQSLIDKAAFLVMKKPPFTYECINEDIIIQLAAQDGLILLGSHIGAWEIAGNLLRDRLDVPFNMVMLDAERPEVKAVMEAATANRRIAIIDAASEGAMIAILAALRRREIVCIAGDRILHRRQVTAANFLGAPALFPQGPFLIAAIAQVPLIPIFTLKTGLLHYRFQAWKPFLFNGVGKDAREQAVGEAISAFAGILECVVREHPEQWFNFYDFWSSSAEYRA
jgi:predicted LPLAT superfamily acyltransferase